MKTAQSNYSPRRNLIRLVILMVVAFEARNVWSAEGQVEDEAMAAVESSRQARAEVEKSLPSRKVAGLTEDETRWAKEFEELQREDTKGNWFDEVDKVIDN